MTAVEHISGSRGSESFEITPARYAKSKCVIRLTREKPDVWKSRGGWLAKALGGEWTRRNDGYSVSHATALDFALLFSAGFEPSRRYFASDRRPYTFTAPDGQVLTRRAAVALAATIARAGQEVAT